MKVRRPRQRILLGRQSTQETTDRTDRAASFRSWDAAPSERAGRAVDGFGTSSDAHAASADATTGRDGRNQDLSPDLKENTDYLKSVFDHALDFVARSFRLADGREAAVVFSKALCDETRIDVDVLAPLMRVNAPELPTPYDDQSIESIGSRLPVSNSQAIHTLQDAVDHVLLTKVILFVDGQSTALSFDLSDGASRAVEEPSTESVIRGPREGFTEKLETNISLLRRRLRTPAFKMEVMEVGRYTKSKVMLCYLDEVASPQLLDEARRRLQRIDIDGIIDSGYIEELIEDTPYSPFPQLQNTERPDVVAANLLEGRIAILTDGSPFALIAPINLWGALQAAEDYYERYLIANAIRWLRYAFLVIALTLPASYVAITTFHPEMLPTRLLLTVAAARDVTPFPAVVECLMMEVTFEALREAGVRLPKTVGSAISIVGALVIGQAAVEAGIVSAPMVIVVSLTGIASFCIPRFNFAISIRMLRFPIILMAGFLGVFGIAISVLAVLIHLCSLRSFGQPYLQPVAPYNRDGMKDAISRVPRWQMMRRPREGKQNARRQSAAMKPSRRNPQGQEP
ncbi:spore germination protein [Alicyclobacillus cycloheptanicus]|uniref:Spore germination protein KA n=1 Tax=Alicyclobacillus cycloheptanicus TaxID=1457 RepID=A0ABT9XJL4_9BACL|nr:spore germination protein [Alicyclobacillus cycloheptanicus]MDQ0190234.1 spore germination protein KA [Alicyclobacillus cycloheptanicus]